MSFSSRALRLSGNNLASPGKKIIQMQKKRRRIKRKNPIVKSGSRELATLAQTSHSWHQTGATDILPSGKWKKRNHQLNGIQRKPSRGEHRSAALQIFTPYFSSALSPPLSALSDWLTAAAEMSGRRESNSGISTPQISASRRLARSHQRPTATKGLEQTDTGAPSLRSQRVLAGINAHANSGWHVGLV